MNRIVNNIDVSECDYHYVNNNNEIACDNGGHRDKLCEPKHWQCYFYINYLQGQLEKYKQTLKEVLSIVENYIDNEKLDSLFSNLDELEQIQTKISEVLNEQT